MAADMFLKIDGIKGETQDEKHANEIEVQSWSWGAHQMGTFGSGGGGGAGKASFNDFSFIKRVDNASATLFLKCATGAHIKNAILTCRKAGGKQEEYLVVTFEDILVSSYTPSGVGAEGPDVVGESITLNFKKVKMDYKPQKEDGSLGPAVSTGYDLKTSKAIG